MHYILNIDNLVDNDTLSNIEFDNWTYHLIYSIGMLTTGQ